MKKKIQVPQPAAFKCYNFLTEEGERAKTVIIVPIKVKEAEDGALLFSWACSRGEFCQDASCIYSKVRRNRNANE